MREAKATVADIANSASGGGNKAPQSRFVTRGAFLESAPFHFPDTFLERVKLQLYYSYLVGQRGLFDVLPYFGAELSYALDKDGYFDIKLTYERGREYETFEECEVWKTSFGYKF